jgi:hypothetical protein
MASTGAVVYFRPRGVASSKVNRRTSGAVYVPFRDVSGIFTSGGSVSDEDNATQGKALYPGPRVKMVDSTGMIADPWHRFFVWLLNDKLGGVDAPSLTDVATSVTGVQQAVTSTVSNVSLLTDQSAQNAAALDTVKEVVQGASLPGSSQIPPVQRTLLP